MSLSSLLSTSVVSPLSRDSTTNSRLAKDFKAVLHVGIPVDEPGASKADPASGRGKVK